ncbi:transcription factor IIIB 60 kDa subunit [Rutidosis leptorrhynchoides]|uniref:transcription factor IIIB 60 kDa subunit n=1 Tax=Rutidosis leptorrhynchoides TaxID=125765 RepID=UPI003A99CAD4
MVYCDFCCMNVSGDRPYDSHLCCNFCGKVLEDNNFSSETTFVKNAAGQSKMAGNYVRMQSDIGASRERTLAKARDDMKFLKDGLQLDDSNEVLNVAYAFYTVALERNFTRGRRVDKVQAACLYLACRDLKKPFLLIDFSSYLRMSVYELGAVYLQLCEVLYIANPEDFHKLVDPSIFLYKFMRSLIPGENLEVLKTARDIIASMKRDWMQTGRKPSGLCGAALYISALTHGIKCSKMDIVKVVHVCEATLTKRLIEFENTESGSLSIEEFKEKVREFQISSSGKQPNNASGIKMLCKHKDSEKPFAYGLCRSCYDDFMMISGGTEGGLDPPAFQIAERERKAKASSEGNGNENSDLGIFSRFEKSDFAEPESIGISSGTGNEKVSFNDDTCEKLPTVDNSTGSMDESDCFSDIDDDEVDCYLHTEEEKGLKKIIWESMNREYLEEQAAKEAAIEAAKAALEVNFEGTPEELQAAQELVAATAAAVAKSKKEKQQKRAADAKNATPAQSAAEATRQMLTKKRLSKKINYDMLDKLFDESEPPEKAKKQRTDENDNDNYNAMGKKENKLDENGELGQEDDDEEKGDAQEEDNDYDNFEQGYEEEEYYEEY